VIARTELGPQGKPWDTCYTNVSQAIGDWIFAVCLLFRMMGDARFGLPQLQRNLYPPPRLRQLVVLQTATHYVCMRRKDATLKGVTANLNFAIRRSEIVFEKITGQRSEDGLRDALSPTSEEHLKSLEKHWKESLRDRLLPYAYTRLIDFESEDLPGPQTDGDT
jgi:hypothetical protein